MHANLAVAVVRNVVLPVHISTVKNEVAHVDSLDFGKCRIPTVNLRARVTTTASRARIPLEICE